MSQKTSTQNTGAIGLGGALFILFLALKLTGVIAWSWWWVTAPLCIPVGIVAAGLAVFGIVALIIKGLK